MSLWRWQYSRGYKKCDNAEKMFESLAIFSCSLQCCFSVFFWPREKQICMWEDLFLYTAHSGHHRRPWRTPFFKSGFFYKMPGQNKTKGSKKLLMAKMPELGPIQSRIRQKNWTATADHLGRQKLTKENLAGPKVFLPRRITRIIKVVGIWPKNLLNSSFFA